MIKILKASAGSGKTYHLAETYIRLLLTNDDPYAYRHILAVTFTNKATDEMKGRILKELHILSTNPGKSPYTKDFVPEHFASVEDLKRKSGDILLHILHDYGAFAVSTIDRFFQRTLKAFSREIGQFASYQVELDKEALVAETVDRILDSLSEDDKALLGWLSDNMMEQLEQGQKPDLEGSLSEIASRLKSDEHRTVIEENGIDEEKTYSRESLSALRKTLRKVISDFGNDIKNAAADVAKAFSDNGLSPDETSRGFMGATLSKISAMKPGSAVPVFTESFRKKAVDYSTWFKKAPFIVITAIELALTLSLGYLAKVCDAPWLNLWSNQDGATGVVHLIILVAFSIFNLWLSYRIFKRFQIITSNWTNQ